jgi:hypothetical protein
VSVSLRRLHFKTLYDNDRHRNDDGFQFLRTSRYHLVNSRSFSSLRNLSKAVFITTYEVPIYRSGDLESEILG